MQQGPINYNNTRHTDLTAEAPAPAPTVMDEFAAEEYLVFPYIGSLFDLFGKNGDELGLLREEVRFCDKFLLKANAERFFLFKMSLIDGLRNQDDTALIYTEEESRGKDIIEKLIQQYSDTEHADLKAGVTAPEVMNVPTVDEDLLLPYIYGLYDLFGKSGAELGLSEEEARLCNIFVSRANAERYYVYKIGLTRKIRN